MGFVAEVGIDSWTDTGVNINRHFNSRDQPNLLYISTQKIAGVLRNKDIQLYT